MKKVMELCGRCIAVMKDVYTVTEESCRRKVDCANCGKRHYGAVCRVEKRAVRRKGTDGEKSTGESL